MTCPKCGWQVQGEFCSNCGTPLNTNASKKLSEQDLPESKFTGGAFAYFFIHLFSTLISIITLTLLYPVMTYWVIKWEVNHTYINGRRLIFDGKISQLYGLYIKWILLSIITLTIYYWFCVPISLQKWQTKHTHINGITPSESKFTGGALGYFGVNFVCNLVTIITCGIGFFWATCHLHRWKSRHTIIDGYRIEFDGTALQYFGKLLLWGLLTIITLGIFIFWYGVKEHRWVVKHTVFISNQILPPINSMQC